MNLVDLLVMAGLDPAIHRSKREPLFSVLDGRINTRVKPECMVRP